MNQSNRSPDGMFIERANYLLLGSRSIGFSEITRAGKLCRFDGWLFIPSGEMANHHWLFLKKTYKSNPLTIPKPEWFGTISAQLAWLLTRQKT
jgi:hypothetical protein